MIKPDKNSIATSVITAVVIVFIMFIYDLITSKDDITNDHLNNYIISSNEWVENMTDHNYQLSSEVKAKLDECISILREIGLQFDKSNELNKELVKVNKELIDKIDKLK